MGQKKWRLENFISPAILKGVLSLKLHNFAVKSNSENRFTLVQKNSESLPFFNLFFCGIIADTFPYDLGRNKEQRSRFYIIQHIVR